MDRVLNRWSPERFANEFKGELSYEDGVPVITNADFSEHTFVKERFGNSQKPLIFRECIGRNTNFFGCNLTGVHFEKCNLGQAVFVSTIMDDVVFKGTNLTGACILDFEPESSECGFFIQDCPEATGLKISYHRNIEESGKQPTVIKLENSNLAKLELVSSPETAHLIVQALNNDLSDSIFRGPVYIDSCQCNDCNRADFSGLVLPAHARKSYYIVGLTRDLASSRSHEGIILPPFIPGEQFTGARYVRALQMVPLGGVAGAPTL